MAAPGELRVALARAAARRGITVDALAARDLTRRLYQCGESNPPDGRYTEHPVVRCDRCGQRYDQDRNAELLLLAASGRVPPPGSGDHSRAR